MTEVIPKRFNDKVQKHITYGGMTTAIPEKNGLMFPYYMEMRDLTDLEKDLYAKAMTGQTVWYRDNEDANEYVIKAVRYSTKDHPKLLVFDIARKSDNHVKMTDVPFTLVFATKELCLKAWDESQQVVLGAASGHLRFLQFMSRSSTTLTGKILMNSTKIVDLGDSSLK